MVLLPYTCPNICLTMMNNCTKEHPEVTVKYLDKSSTRTK